jgi:UDP-N-acetylmuramoyl-L-alanyl-D-glutamate--2,6-diaminopimelate ligase
LAAAVPQAAVTTGGEREVRRVVSDSRRAQPGDLFVAIPGSRTDGAVYVADAIARGAAAVAAEPASVPHFSPLPADVGVLVVPNAREAVGELAAVLAGRPSDQLRLVGVTGTDGKTTTTQLIAAVLAAAGRRIGWMTTVDLRIGEERLPNPYGLTTPEASDIQETLDRFVAAGVEDAVIEVSSHALAMERVRGCAFEAAVFTNLAPEHLDFHGSMEAYAAAKARLFAMLDSPTPKRGSRMGVVNVDDPHSWVMAAASPAAVVSYAIDNVADVTATHIELGLGRTRFRLVTPIGELDIETRFTGRHNVSNWLAAAAVALGWGIDLEVVQRAAEATDPPPGRLQPVRRGQPFEVIVDFAHTPQALATTLAALRGFGEGRLFLVFGMAGGRDAANRPRMGEIATQETDFFVISTDDPGDEDPAEIAAQVAAGARAAGAREGERFVIELDRREAIRTLFTRAGPGDVVLLAGKGHEQRMRRAEHDEPWSDQRTAEELLAEMGYR